MFTSHHLYLIKKVIFTTLAVLLMAYFFMIFLTHSPFDPSWSSLSSSSNMDDVSNVGGLASAWLSDVLYAFFGWSAWWLLVFLGYEAVCLWWQRSEPAFLLRLLAYAFILIASATLLTGGLDAWQMYVNGTTDPVQTGGTMQASNVSNSNFSNIVGMELSRRLNSLMPLWATLFFLIIFLGVAITYAFNIRWRAMFKGLFVGVMGKPAQIAPQDKVSGAIEEDSAYVKEGLESDTLSPAGQLPLDFTPLNAKAEDDFASLPFEDEEHIDADVLGDFLATSTINDTLLTTLEEESQAKTALEIEPDIDPVTLDDETQTQTEPVKRMNIISPESVVEQSIDDDDLSSESLNQDDLNVDLDGEEPNQLSKNVSNLISDRSEQDDTYDQTAINDILDAQSEQIATESEPQVDAPASTEDYVQLDMTPSNTPPADPTAEPVVLDEVKEEGIERFDEDVSVSSPTTISFAVPEGDASNQIDDLMPEDGRDDTDDESTASSRDGNSRDDLVLAAIDDDDAFKSHSRAMQTARYRESLTPIPELSILDKPDPDRKPSYTEAELTQLSELLEIKLQDFNVKAEVVNAIPGPVVTRFEVELAPGVKASKVTGISRDLARSLSMASLRVVEVIPGKPYIGIEVPNKKREMVRLIELLETDKYKDPKAQISMAMGKDIGGKPIITDLARAPHMLVAGTTGSGKSVLVNSMLLSMLLKYTPDQLRLILIDPKQLELANYNDIPHLLTPVVTDMNEAASSLSWCVAEMERRYQLMSLLRVRKLGEFNKKVQAAEKAGKPIIDPLWRPNDSVGMDKAPKLKTLPMIVIVADEFADMIMQVGKQAEELITRLAQKSRAAGIHLMLATQRPSVDVITGLIKANIPVRAALRVNSKVDSRTILDSGGAEDMLGNGDMLFLGPGQIEPDRVHGAFVSDEEVNRVCEAWRERGAPDYIDNMADNFALESPSGSGGNTSGEDDDLYDQAVAFILETRKVSASSIQRKFSIGYNRAARIVDSMEEAGLVSSMGKSGKREILM